MEPLKLFSVLVSISRRKLTGIHAGLLLATDRIYARNRVDEDVDLGPQETLERLIIKEVKGPFINGQLLMMKEIL